MQALRTARAKSKSRKKITNLNEYKIKQWVINWYKKNKLLNKNKILNNETNNNKNNKKKKYIRTNPKQYVKNGKLLFESNKVVSSRIIGLTTINSQIVVFK